MGNDRVARVAGFHDVLPQRFGAYKTVEATITQQFERYGYAPIALPIVEYSELFMRKSGEDIVTRMYDFQHRGHRLCLRPEMTSSVMRAYIEHMQDHPLPVRLYYSGPVFRLQNTSHKQFNQVGLELIGAYGSLADGEVIRAACSALDSLNLEQYRLVVGHVGILHTFLNNLDIDGQLRSFLLLNLSTLREQGRGYVAERLAELHPVFSALTSQQLREELGLGNPTRSTKLVSLLRDMQADEARALISEILDSLNVRLDDYRDKNQLIDRLLTKLRRGDRSAALNTALDFMSELVQIRGKPHEVIRECANLLNSYKVTGNIIEYLVDLLECLFAFGVNSDRVELDVGMSLGLHYYTGLVFEILHNDSRQAEQLCGGGRYDDLIALLGGSYSQPASGFSFSLEAICTALDIENRLPETTVSIPRILVAPDGQNAALALRLSETLRALGCRVELDVHSRSTDENLAYARRNGVPFVILVREREDSITLIDWSRSQQFRLDQASVINWFKSMLCESAVGHNEQHRS